MRGTLCRSTLIAACVLSLAACLSRPVAPLVAPQQPRARIVVQREFRLGTLDFGRPAGDGQDLNTVIPAMLLTELRDGGRFAVYEGGSIRVGSHSAGFGPGNPHAENAKPLPLNEDNASEHVDGYLSGTVTTLSAQQACFDLRLSNAVTHEVLYARAACVPVADNHLDRAAVSRIAEEVARAIKQVGNGKVTSADGGFVFCDKGAQAGVSRGMVAYLVATGDTVADAAIHREVQRYTGVDPAQLATAATPVVVGEMYIVSVEDRYSVGVIYRGSYALPGDTVFFK